MNTTSRRKRTLGISLLAALSLVVVACGSDGSKGPAGSNGSAGSGDAKGSLTFANYGGGGMDAAKAGWLQPFTEKTGVTFQTDQPVDQAKIKAMVQSGKTSWDVVDIDTTAAGPECGKLYEKRPADFDISELDPKLITDECSIPIIGQTVALVYNKKLYGDNPPTSITDFMDTKTFPGKRITFNYWTGSAEPLLMAAGVPSDQIYPIDWDKLNKAVNKLGSEMVFQSTIDQQVQAEESGNFGMCLCYLGRSALAAQNGANIGVVWDQVYTAWDGMFVVKGTKNPTAAWDFVQYIATSAGQNGFYKQLPYTSTTTGTPPAVPDEFKPFMETFNKDKVQQNVTMDVPYWSSHAAEAADKWTALTSG